MKTVYIVYHSWYSSYNHCEERSVDAIFENKEEAELYISKQPLNWEYEIDSFGEFYQAGEYSSKM